MIKYNPDLEIPPQFRREKNESWKEQPTKASLEETARRIAREARQAQKRARASLKKKEKEAKLRAAARAEQEEFDKKLNALIRVNR